MRFSRYFDIVHTNESSWFDPLLDQDTPLYVDPFLVFDDRDNQWAGTKQEVVDFFDAAAQLIEQSEGSRESLAYQKCMTLLSFPEPNEFCLGLSMGNPRGSGTGKRVAEDMIKALDLARQHGHTQDLASIAGFNLFTDGIGLDRISDILCNILKHRFIQFTQEIATDQGITTHPVKVKHPGWERERARWLPDTTKQLPRSPHNGAAVLLIPVRFLKEIPTISRDSFWKWAENNEANQLRQDFGYEVAEGLNQTERRTLVLQPHLLIG